MMVALINMWASSSNVCGQTIVFIKQQDVRCAEQESCTGDLVICM